MSFFLLLLLQSPDAPLFHWPFSHSPFYMRCIFLSSFKYTFIDRQLILFGEGLMGSEGRKDQKNIKTHWEWVRRKKKVKKVVLKKQLLQQLKFTPSNRVKIIFISFLFITSLDDEESKMKRKKKKTKYLTWVRRTDMKSTGKKLKMRWADVHPFFLSNIFFFCLPHFQATQQ